jgi:hypothetical protein
MYGGAAAGTEPAGPFSLTTRTGPAPRRGAEQMPAADYNVRDVFFLFTGRCGHKWVGPRSYEKCPTCGDFDYGQHVIAQEPIAVNFAYTLDKVQRQIKRAVREWRHRKRKTATIISLASHRPQPNA